MVADGYATFTYKFEDEETKEMSVTTTPPRDCRAIAIRFTSPTNPDLTEVIVEGIGMSIVYCLIYPVRSCGVMDPASFQARGLVFTAHLS